MSFSFLPPAPTDKLVSSKAFKTWVDGELDRRIRQDFLPACPLKTLNVNYEGGIRRDAIHVKRGRKTIFNSSEGLIRYSMIFADPETFHEDHGSHPFYYDSELGDEGRDFKFSELSVNKERAEKHLRETGSLNVVDFIETNDPDDVKFSELIWIMDIAEPKESSASGFIKKYEELLQQNLYFENEDSHKVQELRDCIWVLLCRSNPSSFQERFFDFTSVKYSGQANCESHAVFLFSTLNDGDFRVHFTSDYDGST